MRNLLLLIFALITFFFTSCQESGNIHSYKPTAKEIHKKTYKLGIHPYLNSKKMYASYRPILDFIESEIGGITLILETSSSYAQYNKKLYRGDFDFSLPNPFQTYNALDKGYQVIARMKPDDVFRGIFVARKSSHLTHPNQIKGRTISFPAPTALAATMMPLYYLYEQGIDVKKDIRQYYVGSQYSSILNAYSGDAIAAATWPPPWDTWVKENPQKAQSMEVVWQTEPLINNGFVVKKNIDTNLVTKIQAVLLELDTTPNGKKLLKNAGFDGFQVAINSDYDRVETFLKQYDKAIGIPK
jgi:phosphonate transport system substrate-binding protein